MTCCLYTKLDEAEGLLYDVYFICWYRSTFGTSLAGRQARMNALSILVFIPGLLEKRGEMSREAYLRLPDSLIKKIRALYLLLCANSLAMAGLYFFGY